MADTPTLAQMTPRAQGIALEYYAAGVEHGIELGRRQYLDEDTAAWANMREVIRAAAATPTYDVLAERRGQHERARAHRALMVERGVTA